jgi:hypothetical protein
VSRRRMAQRGPNTERCGRRSVEGSRRPVKWSESSTWMRSNLRRRRSARTVTRGGWHRRGHHSEGEPMSDAWTIGHRHRLWAVEVRTCEARPVATGAAAPEAHNRVSEAARWGMEVGENIFASMKTLAKQIRTTLGRTVPSVDITVAAGSEQCWRGKAATTQSTSRMWTWARQGKLTGWARLKRCQAMGQVS